MQLFRSTQFFFKKMPKCRYCPATFPRSELKNHELECVSERYIRQDCSTTIPTIRCSLQLKNNQVARSPKRRLIRKQSAIVVAPLDAQPIITTQIPKAHLVSQAVAVARSPIVFESTANSIPSTQTENAVSSTCSAKEPFSCDSKSPKSLDRSEHLSLELFQIVNQYILPRAAHEQLVRYTNRVITEVENQYSRLISIL